MPKVSHICLTGEEKPRKNLTQETCPDRGSNLGPLRDKRACYHLLNSGGLFGFEQPYMFEILVTCECACECRLSTNLCKRALDVTADVIVEAKRNADMLTVSASEDQ